MLYELHLPLVMLANRQLQRGPSAVADSGQKDTVKRYLKVRVHTRPISRPSWE